MNANPYGLLGTFSKGVPGSVTINFAPSGSDWCSESCCFKHARSTDERPGCYAQPLERNRPSMARNLERKQADLAGYLRRLAEPRTLEKLHTAPWIRLCAFGALPPPSLLESDEDARQALMAFAAELRDLRPHVYDRLHIPCENGEKAHWYRLTLGWPVRESLGLRYVYPEGLAVPFSSPNDLFLAWRAVQERLLRGPVSISVPAAAGRGYSGWQADAVHESRIAANIIRDGMKRADGKRKVIVCPAIAGRAKCGDCRACVGPAFGGADVVIYPEHR